MTEAQGTEVLAKLAEVLTALEGVTERVQGVGALAGEIRGALLLALGFALAMVVLRLMGFGFNVRMLNRGESP